MSNDKKYNHAFSVNFEVPDSSYENWDDCLLEEKDKVFASFFKRMVDLFKNGEYLEAMEGFDTYEQEDMVKSLDNQSPLSVETDWYDKSYANHLSQNKL